MNFDQIAKKGALQTDIEQAGYVPGRRGMVLPRPYRYEDIGYTGGGPVGAGQIAQLEEANQREMEGLIRAHITQKTAFGQLLKAGMPVLTRVYLQEGRSGQYYKYLNQILSRLMGIIGPIATKKVFNQLVSVGSQSLNALGFTTPTMVGLQQIGMDQGLEQYLATKISPKTRFGIRGETDQQAGAVAGAKKNLAQFSGQNYLSGLQLSQGYLNSFPQWIGKNIKKSQAVKEKLDKQFQLQQRLLKPDDRQLSQLVKFDPGLVLDGNIYKGHLADNMQTKIAKKASSLQQRWQKGQALLSTTISKQQAAQQIPAFVNQIVQANSNLSKVGFGPIGNGTSSLYAGRWLDSVTGKMRVLPTANQKYLNPSVKQQKLGYLQAKILNHWNQCVSSFDQYQKLKISNKNFAESAARSIQSSLDMGNLQLQYFNFIYRRLVAHAADPMRPTPTSALLRLVNTARFKTLFSDVQHITDKLPVPDDYANRTTPVLQDAFQAVIRQWQIQIGQAQATLQAKIDAQLANDIEKQQAKYKLSKAYLSLTSYQSKKLKGAFNKLLRLTIPKKMNYQFINKGLQTYDKTRTQLNRLMQDPDTAAFNVASLDQLQTIGSNISSKLKRGFLPSADELTQNMDYLRKLVKPQNPNRVFTNSRYPTLKNINQRAFGPPINLPLIDPTQQDARRRLQLTRQRQRERQAQADRLLLQRAAVQQRIARDFIDSSSMAMQQQPGVKMQDIIAVQSSSNVNNPSSSSEPSNYRNHSMPTKNKSIGKSANKVKDQPKPQPPSIPKQQDVDKLNIPMPNLSSYPAAAVTAAKNAFRDTHTAFKVPNFIESPHFSKKQRIELQNTYSYLKDVAQQANYMNKKQIYANLEKMAHLIAGGDMEQVQMFKDNLKNISMSRHRQFAQLVSSYQDLAIQYSKAKGIFSGWKR